MHPPSRRPHRQRRRRGLLCAPLWRLSLAPPLPLFPLHPLGFLPWEDQLAGINAYFFEGKYRIIESIKGCSPVCSVREAEGWWHVACVCSPGRSRTTHREQPEEPPPATPPSPRHTPRFSSPCRCQLNTCPRSITIILEMCRGCKPKSLQIFALMFNEFASAVFTLLLYSLSPSTRA